MKGNNMAKKFFGTIIGLGMMGLAVGAFLSNEPASKTDQGHIMILVVFVMGLSVLVSGLTSKPKPVVSAPVIPVVNTPLGPTCPSCHKAVSSEFAVCPYCATVLKPKCPNCGKEVSHDFKNCPYCGTQLPVK